MSTERDTTPDDGTETDGRTEADTRVAIDRAAEAVGRVWPLHSFVTANPLAGFEDRPFPAAVRAGERLFGGRGYPCHDTVRRAWENGRIDPELLAAALAERGVETDAEASLDRLAERDRHTARAIEADGDSQTGREATADDAANNDRGVVATDTETARVDQLVTKWLAAFLDEGTAHWSMPNREQGFYAAVRSVARHDREIPNRERLADLPSEPVAAIEQLLADRPTEQWERIFKHQFAALPGWTGLVAHRAESNGQWQSAHPITLPGYLAVRLAVADAVGAPIDPPSSVSGGNGATAGEHERSELSSGEADGVQLREAWLSAWEATYRRELVAAVTDRADARETPSELRSDTQRASTDDARPDAQLVFCIDTRSEVIRRHVEAAGEYETHGYAGFFGVPMRYEGYDAAVAADACPPIVEPRHRIAERPVGDPRTRDSYDSWSAVLDAGQELIDTLSSNAATAFSFVESAGAGYGAALAARTLVPTRVRTALSAIDDRVAAVHEFCRPSIDHESDGVGLTLDERIEYAATAFELMGWKRFARLVVFVGHASETTNNPFAASLDCGACAGNPGGPNARVLAQICNDNDVRAGLRERGIEIPEDTVFVAGQHDTTTDRVTLYDDRVPESHQAELAELRRDLAAARAGATAERVGDNASADGTRAHGETADTQRDEAEPAHERAIRETERRAGDWAETRPEWGLAGNAGFVIGPRSLTEKLTLDGRVFLHSYDPTTDPDGDALEAILTGPMVVTQWINTAYYFATVDTAVYGSGSKVTQNPVGNVGVYQGNGGDLMTGLPTQSVLRAADEPYHQPLRLSTVVYAPVDRVRAVLADHEHLTDLLDNNWLSLVVVDPTQNDRAVEYDGDGTWRPVFESASDAEPTASSSITDP